MQKILFVFFVFLTLASPGQNTFRKVFSSTGEDEAVAVFRTSGNGYFVVGNTSGYGHGGKDVWLIALDSNAVFQWQKTYGTAGNERAVAALLTPDDNLLITGIIQTNGYQVNGFLWKLTPTGVPVFQKTFGGPEWDEVSAITFFDDSLIAVAGQSYNGPHPGYYDPFIKAFDPRGDTLWTAWPPTAGEEKITAVTSAGNRIFSVGAALNHQGQPDTAVIKSYDFDGQMKWSMNFSDSLHQIYLTAVPQSDTTVTVAGYYQAGTMSYADECIMTFDSSGQILWYHSMPTGGPAYINHLAIQPSGHYIVTAMSEKFNGGIPGLHVSRYTPGGWWEEGFVGQTKSIDEPVMSLFHAGDSTYLTLATTQSSFVPFTAIALVQTDYQMNFDTSAVYEVISGLKSHSQNEIPLLVFPNPVAGFLTIQSQNKLPEGHIKIISSNGKLLIDKAINNGLQKINISVSTLSRGIYFLEYQSREFCFRTKVVKL